MSSEDDRSVPPLEEHELQPTVEQLREGQVQEIRDIELALDCKWPDQPVELGPAVRETAHRFRPLEEGGGSTHKIKAVRT